MDTVDTRANEVAEVTLARISEIGIGIGEAHLNRSRSDAFLENIRKLQPEAKPKMTDTQWVKRQNAVLTFS